MRRSISITRCSSVDDGDCYDKLARVNALFKGTALTASPKILTPLNRHIQARGIDRVVFKTLGQQGIQQG
jgi:hypothetical protein